MDSKIVQKCNDMEYLLDQVYKQSRIATEDIKEDFIDVEFLEEIITLNRCDNVAISIDKSLKKIKGNVRDSSDREHCIYIVYLGRSKLKIQGVELPPSHYHSEVFSRLEPILDAFKEQIASLSDYFFELEKIDRFCNVVEPLKPSFKDDYRKIVLDARIWLHLEVTAEGNAVNMHLIGSVNGWQQKLQERLPKWDFDKDIVDNILCIFDLTSFPESIDKDSSRNLAVNNQPVEVTCSICLCGDLGEGAAPQPLCSNEKCGAYFHAACLFEWLVSSAGGRIPTIRVAFGTCPSCLAPISCSAL